MKRKRPAHFTKQRRDPAKKRKFNKVLSAEGQDMPTFYSRKQALYPLLAEKGRMVKLRYIETQSTTLGAAAATFASVGYRANSAFDPSTVVASPGIPGFTEWAAIYNKYRVMAVSAKAKIISLEANHPVFVGILFNNPTTVVTTWNAWLETIGQPYSRLESLSPIGTGFNKCEMKQYCPLKNLLGDPNEYLSDATYAAATSGNPASGLSFNIFVASYDGVTNISAPSINILLTLDYYVYVYDRKVLLQ